MATPHQTRPAVIQLKMTESQHRGLLEAATVRNTTAADLIRSGLDWVLAEPREQEATEASLAGP